MRKNLRDKAKRLAGRPYIVKVVLDETTDGQSVYMATAPELEGCFGQGETIAEAVKSLSEARVDFIYSLLEDNLPIPNPSLVITTTASLTTTLILRYRQSDIANPSDSKEAYDNFEKPLRLFEGTIRV